MGIKVVLFDLDGTLLPMDQDIFVKMYFGLLAKKLAPKGYDPDQLIKAVWAGTKAMMKNDGYQTNEETFWEIFCGLLGEHVLEDKPLFEEYYRNEFQNVKSYCGFNPKAAEVVYRLKEEGFRVALATNPLFPSIATESRIRWAGLEPEDFELYTTYEDNRYCKPHLEYYRDILKKLEVQPEDCIMIGNDVSEDMITEKLGMKVFLLTDSLINTEGKDISVYPHGSFDEALEYVLGQK